MKIFLYSAIFLFVVIGNELGVGADDTHNEPARLSLDANPGVRTFPVITIPTSQNGTTKYYDMVLDKSGRRKFRVTSVKPGKTLKINAYVISSNIIDAKDSGKYKGDDMPDLKSIQSSLNEQSPERFLDLVAKLAEQRRRAYTLAESEIANSRQPEGGDSNDFMFGTGFVEVSGRDLSTGDTDLRYFVPIQDIRSGAAKLDTRNAKLEILRGLSIYIFRELSDTYNSVSEKDVSYQRALTAGKEIETLCLSDHCSEKAGSDKFGDLAAMLADLHRMGSNEMFDDDSTATLMRRKSFCILKIFKMACPKLPIHSELSNLIQDPALDCTNPTSILVGLTTEK